MPSIPTGRRAHDAGAHPRPQHPGTAAGGGGAALIVNTHARRGRHWYAQAGRLLARDGIRLQQSYPIRDPGRLPETVRNVIAAGARLVIIGGGDGTISAVVDEFAYRHVVLAILPLGTANSFARTLGIPLDIADAIGVIRAGETAAVDLGRIGDDYFANTAALGLASAIARSRLTALKRYLGPASYPLVGAAKFLGHRAFRCTLSREGRRTVLDALDVLIANGRYQGGALVEPGASVESRRLVIRIVKGPNRRNLLRVWALTAAGRRPGPALVETVHAETLEIDAVPAQHVSIDGEVVARTPVTVSVAPDALKVRVPQGFARRQPAPRVGPR